MKHILLILTVMAFVVVGCSDCPELLPANQTSNNVTTTVNNIGSKRTVGEAIQIASNVLKKTKSGERGFYEQVDYVLAENRTRSANLPDTLAYIINYPQAGGFAIISADQRVNPLLAYSLDGRFDKDNESAKNNFLDMLEPYMEEEILAVESNQNSLSISGDLFHNVVDSVWPRLKIKLHQDAPWNSFVEITHEPGCVAGCVPVAMALIMTHCKSRLTYHDKVFPFSSMVSAISRKQKEQNSANEVNTMGVRSSDIEGLIDDNLYSFAVNNMAQLLDWIGTDIGAIYTAPSDTCNAKTSAKASDARNWFSENGFTVSSGLRWFNDVSIANSLKDKNLIYMYGQRPGGGHAWVCDGFVETRGPIFDITLPIQYTYYLHIDWGWGGSSNGYFTGDVYKVSSTREYTPIGWFNVKIEI